MPSDAPDAKLRWEDGDLPVSERFDDPYYSRADGLAESRHVFLDGNALAERFAGVTGTFHIAELGFGTGLNMIAALALWRERAPPGRLHLTSFEKYPLPAADMARALACWPELAAISSELLGQWPARQLDFGTATLTLVEGDIAETLPGWPGPVDAWFLDGFAPARNPQMWTESVLQGVGRTARQGSTFATYSAAGFVRRGLQAAGFEVEKRPGYGSKREMLTGRKP